MMFHVEIADAASRFSIPVGLIHAIIQVESMGNPWAIRFEPSFKKLYLDGRSDPETSRVYGPVSVETEKAARATSWGLMQIMGQVARERGCTMAFLSELCRPEAGIEYGCRQLKHLIDRRGPNWNDVISSYNQGSPRLDNDGRYVNQGYVNKVRALWA